MKVSCWKKIFKIQRDLWAGDGRWRTTDTHATITALPKQSNRAKGRSNRLYDQTAEELMGCGKGHFRYLRRAGEYVVPMDFRTIVGLFMQWGVGLFECDILGIWGYSFSEE